MVLWSWLTNQSKTLLLLTFPGWVFCQSPKKSFSEFKYNYIKNINQLYEDTSNLQIRYYSWKKRYLRKATIIPQDTPQVVQLIQSDHTVKEYLVVGQIKFTLHGQTHFLTAYKDLQHLRNPLLKTLIFIPFNDLTNGHSTYSGGRYLQIRHSNDQLTIWVDFNQSTNPLCVYRNTSCPLVPITNRVKVNIRAGEKNPGLGK